MKIKWETISDWAAAHNVIWFFYRYCDEDKALSPHSRICDSTSYVKSIYICWVPIDQDLARVSPFLIWDMTLGVGWVTNHPKRCNVEIAKWKNRSSGAVPLGCKESRVAGHCGLSQIRGEDPEKRNLVLVICFCCPCFLLSMLSVCLFWIMNRSTKRRMRHCSHMSGVTLWSKNLSVVNK